MKKKLDGKDYVWKRNRSIIVMYDISGGRE